MDPFMRSPLREWKLETTYNGSRRRNHRRESRDECWETLRCLGNGSSGTVWQERCVSGTSPNTNTLRAVKQLRKQQSTFLEMSRRELDALSTFSDSHTLEYTQHFVQFLGWFDDQEHLYIAMEFVEYGDLQKFISARSAPFPEPEAALMVTQVARALQYMHLKNFVHRDIKPLNILVCSPGPDWHVKVADFGITKRTDGTGLGTHGIGSPGYIAPELYGNTSDQYTAAVDVWALGAVAFCLRTCYPPFSTIKDLLDYARDHRCGIPLQRLGRSSGFCVSFVLGTLAELPERRLTIAHVLSHDWLCGGAGSSGFSGLTTSSAPWSMSPSNAWSDTFSSSDSQQPRALSSSTPMTDGSLSFPSLHTNIEEGSQERLALELEHLAIARGGQEAGTNKSAAPGDKAPDMLTVMARLATTYRKQKRYDRAEITGEDVVNLRREAFGNKHPDTIAALSDLATTYREQGKYQQLETIDEEILQSNQDILGGEHPDTIQAMANLATVYCEQKKYQQSETISLKILQFNQDILGSKHPDRIQAMANLATAYCEQKRYQQSETISLEILQFNQDILGSKHPDTIQAMANLATVYCEQKKYQQSETISLEILQFNQDILGSKHPDRIQAMANLATAYCEQKKYQQSETISLEILQFNQDILGSKHPDRIQAMANLATAYTEQGKLDKAESTYQELFFLQREAVGGESLLAVQWLENLSRIHYKQGKGIASTEASIRVKIVAGHNFRNRTYGKRHSYFIIATIGTKEIYRTSSQGDTESPKWNEAFETKVDKDTVIIFRAHDGRRSSKKDMYLGVVGLHVGRYMNLEVDGEVEQMHPFRGRTEYMNPSGSLTINISIITPKPLPRPFMQDGIPAGWEKFMAKNGRLYYIDYNKKKITLTMPKGGV